MSNILKSKNVVEKEICILTKKKNLSSYSFLQKVFLTAIYFYNIVKDLKVQQPYSMDNIV